MRGKEGGREGRRREEVNYSYQESVRLKTKT